MMKFLSEGDRVEHSAEGEKGTIKYVDQDAVLVKWDDGRFSLLYFYDNMVPDARRLIRLR